MAEYTKVALDAMGGDNAPVEIIKGAVDAVNKRRDIQVLIVGKEDIIKEELAKYTYDKEQIEIKGASEVIETAEPPVMAIRRKKDSSIYFIIFVKELELRIIIAQFSLSF